MAVDSILVGQLSDGRLQLFATKRYDPQLWSCWKSTDQADSAWTELSPFDPANQNVFYLGAAARLPDPETGLPGAPQLFVPGKSDIPGGADVWTIRKQSSDPDAAWGPWQNFYTSGRPKTRISAVAAAPLSLYGASDNFFVTNQVFMMGDQLLTSWQDTAAGEWVGVRPFEPQPPIGLGSLTAGLLPLDPRLQLWGVADSGAVWTTWKVSQDLNSAWSEWSPFQSPWGASTLSLDLPAAFSVGRPMDGRLQLWACVQDINVGSHVVTCQKSTIDPNSAWTPWQEFLDNELFADTGIFQFTVAALGDGNLQLWAMDGTGALFSTWQVIDPSNEQLDWVPWSAFPGP